MLCGFARHGKFFSTSSLRTLSVSHLNFPELTNQPDKTNARFLLRNRYLHQQNNKKRVHFFPSTEKLNGNTGSAYRPQQTFLQLSPGKPQHAIKRVVLPALLSKRIGLRHFTDQTEEFTRCKRISSVKLAHSYASSGLLRYKSIYFAALAISFVGN